jgi:hypothetical protein
MRVGSRTLLAVVALALAVADVEGSVRGRLQVAPNGRHLQFEDGTPFFYLGDTAWELFHRLSREEPGRTPIINATVPWYDALDHPGARQMGLLRRFIEPRLHQLVPDQRLVVNGPLVGGAKIRAARASDGSFVLVYSPQGAPFTIDKGHLQAERLKEVWFDLRYGVAFEFHRTDNQGFQTYTPPTAGRGQDWVLLIERVE